MRVPTDIEILECIYKNYYHDFAAFDKDPTIRAAKIYVPIDSNLIGKELNVDGDIIFGRLYYHLNNKYSYHRADHTKVEFFALTITSGMRHSINAIQFPLMASVLADMQAERKRFKIGNWIAVGSLIISLAALIISIISINNQQ